MPRAAPLAQTAQARWVRKVAVSGLPARRVRAQVRGCSPRAGSRQVKAQEVTFF